MAQKESWHGEGSLSQWHLGTSSRLSSKTSPILSMSYMRLGGSWRSRSKLTASRDYVKEFTTLMLQIPNLTGDLLFHSMDHLKEGTRIWDWPSSVDPSTFRSSYEAWPWLLMLWLSVKFDHDVISNLVSWLACIFSRDADQVIHYLAVILGYEVETFPIVYFPQYLGAKFKDLGAWWSVINRCEKKPTPVRSNTYL